VKLATGRWWVCASIAAGAMLGPGVARADGTVDQCIDANARGQDLLHDGKLAAARALLSACASPSCPKMIRRDCTAHLDELGRLEPAIVFVAKDPAGNDLSAVGVTMDGVPVTERLDGTPLRLDPGEHVFVFTTAGWPPITKRLVLAERDQARIERIVFERPAHADAPPSPPAPARDPDASPPDAGATGARLPVAPEKPAAGPPASSRGGMTTLQRLGLVGAGVGAAGLAVGGVFVWRAGSALNDQRSACPSATDCPNHAQAVADHSTFVTDNGIATGAFVAGGVLIVAGAVMLVAGGDRSATSTTTGLVLLPGVTPQVASLVVRGAF
jgi:hypothetical protein